MVAVQMEVRGGCSDTTHTSGSQLSGGQSCGTGDVPRGRNLCRRSFGVSKVEVRAAHICCRSRMSPMAAWHCSNVAAPQTSVAPGAAR